MIHSSHVVIGCGGSSCAEKKNKMHEPQDWSKLEDQFTRINASLVTIISNLDSLDRIIEDLEDDPSKATRKQIEFFTRFTRNYLCELRQKMNEIRKYLENSDQDNESKNQTVFQCFLSSFHNVNQAFKNVEKNLRYVIFNKLPTQITEFLNCFSDLCVILNAAYWEGNNEKLLEFEDLNLTLLTKLEDIEKNMKKAEIQKKEKQRTILKIKPEIKKPQISVIKNEKVKSKEKKGINYSMYKCNKVKTFENFWKKRTKALAEAKFGNKEEYLCNSARSKESKEENISDKTIKKINEKLKEHSLKKAKMENNNRGNKRRIVKPISENEMETMVQSVNCDSAISESEPEEELNKKNENCIEKSQGLPQEENENKQEEIIRPKIEGENFTMGPVLDEAFKTMFNHIMSQVMTNIEEKDNSCDEKERNLIAQEVKKYNFRKDNVKLIHIVEDESHNCVEVEN